MRVVEAFFEGINRRFSSPARTATGYNHRIGDHEKTFAAYLQDELEVNLEAHREVIDQIDIRRDDLEFVEKLKRS